MHEWLLLFFFLVLGLLALLLLIYPLRRSKLLLVALIPVFIIAVSIAYWRWGSWIDWKKYRDQEANKQQIEAVLQTIKSPAELIARMKVRLHQEPKSSKGWYLLGRLYASQGLWSEARNAFSTALQFNPNDPLIIVNYAQSVLQLNQQQFNNSIRLLLVKLLQEDPEQPDALSMLAMDAFTSANYRQAIEYWQRLLKLASPQSEEAQMIRKAIAKAQRQLN